MDSDKNNLRKFGITIFIALAAITGLVFFKRHYFSWPILAVSLVFLSLALTAPIILKPAYFAWMKFAFILSWVNTRLILSVIFYAVFTPIGLALKIFGKDLLERKIDKGCISYWKAKETTPLNYEKQF